ncbi:MAG: sulfatase-like hydrolase/transferase [Planctomycetes bacterium]|nr:sulfatase-like hydrolase/transferase [Planctomycetota bacterium]MCK5564920.1 sulfatase-like hydrolase/transferase [Planctomycetota bacterium]
MIKQLLIGIMCMAAVSVGNAAAKRPVSKRPNFLIIMADDVSPEQFGCYGNKENKTPHIDALAESGVMFNTAWATPMCSPTRSLLVTGRYPCRTGVWHNDLRIKVVDNQDRWNFAGYHLTFARVLRKHGYRTAIASNIMALGASVYSKEAGFDEQCIHGLTLADVPEVSVFSGKFEGKYNFPDAKPVPSRYWHPCVIRNGQLVETSPEDFGPDIYTDFLIDFMKRHKKQPFLAYYPMKLVHDIAGGGLPTTPVHGRPGSNKGGNVKDMTEYVDILIGRLVKALDEFGLRENTIVIFTSDNGGSHGKKMHANEDGPRVPFVVSCPSIVNRRGVTSELMEFSDIFPTFMEFSGASVPTGYELDGKSLVPFLTGKSDVHRDSIISYIATARMARTRRWLLEAVDPVYGDPKGRLYDCGAGHLRKQYKEVTGSTDPEVVAARKALEKILDRNPWPSRTDPDVEAEVKSYDNMPYKHYLDTGKLAGKSTDPK